MALADFYPAVKTAHVSFVLASGGLFAVRAAVVLLGSGLAMRAPVRYLSYAIDTALLAAALMLLAILRLNPLATPWLAAKLGLLAAYIMLGSLALKRARGSGRRALAAAGALLCFLAMIAVARTHDPLGFLRWL